MPGLEIGRFWEKLPDFVSNNMCCSICKNIFNNAVTTDCGHDFCKECIQGWIETPSSAAMFCPQCKTQLTRKRSKCGINGIIIGQYVFQPNYVVNKVIGDLEVKCHYNTCQQRVLFKDMSSHIMVCEHRLCTICGFTATNYERHNCAELLKKDRDQLKSRNCYLIRIKDLLQKDHDQLKEDQDKLKNENNTLEIKRKETIKERDLLVVANGKLRKDQDHLNNEKNQLIIQLNAVTAERDKLKKNQDVLKMDNHILTNVNNELKKDIIRLEGQNSELKKTNGDFNKERDKLRKDRDVIINKLENSKIIEESMNQKIVNLQKRIAKLRSKSHWQVKYIELSKQCSNLTKEFQKAKVNWDVIINEGHEQTKLVITLNEQISILHKEIQSLKEFTKLSYIFKKGFQLMMGPYKCLANLIDMNLSRILISRLKLKVNDHDYDNNYSNVTIQYIQMQELLYCTAPSYATMIIKIAPEFCQQIQQRLQLRTASINGTTLTVQSTDTSQLYITIELRIASEGERKTFVSYLEYKSKELKDKIKVQSIDYNQYKEFIKNNYNSELRSRESDYQSQWSAYQSTNQSSNEERDQLNEQLIDVRKDMNELKEKLQQTIQIENELRDLCHAYNCGHPSSKVGCGRPYCTRLKSLIIHRKYCESLYPNLRAGHCCKSCNDLITLCGHHVRRCYLTDGCAFPYCSIVKRHRKDLGIIE